MGRNRNTQGGGGDPYSHSLANIGWYSNNIWNIYYNSSTQERTSLSKKDQGKAREKLNQAIEEINQRNNYARGVELLYNALSFNPYLSEVYHWIAWTYAMHDFELDAALQYVKFAFSLDSRISNHVYYYDTLAQIYFRKNDWERAITNTKESLDVLFRYKELKFRDTFSFLRLGRSYRRLDDLAQADSFYQKVLSDVEFLKTSYGDYPFILKEYGWIKLDKKEYLQALKLYVSAINAFKNSKTLTEHIIINEIGACYNDIGVTHYYLGDIKKCKDHYATAIKVNPANPYPYINLASRCAEEKNRGSFIRFLEAGIQRVVKDPHGYQELIKFMLYDTRYNHSNYRKIMLELLLANKLISSSDYNTHLNLSIHRVDKSAQRIVVSLIEDKISQGDIPDVFEILDKELKDSNQRSVLIIQKQRFYRLQEQHMKGTTSEESAALERNIIIDNLLQLSKSIT